MRIIDAMEMYRSILTTGQAARELGVTRVTILRWCEAAHAGKDSPIRPEECFRPGKDWKIRQTAVQRLTGQLPLSA